MKLKQYLSENKLSMQEFSRKIGVHYSYVAHLIKGRRTPSLSTALKIQSETRGNVPVEVWIEAD